MLRLQLEQVGKKYYHRWLFRNVSCELGPGSRLALVGPNGSGKSTLLRIMGGQLNPSEGKITFFRNKQLPVEQVYQYLSWSGPYIELYQDLNLVEHIRMQFRFKDCLLDDPMEIISILDLESHRNKKLRFYSSGMQQRAKVGLALFTQSELLMLDEPTSNMDRTNAERMLKLIDAYLGERIMVLASNMEREYQPLEKVLTLG